MTLTSRHSIWNSSPNYLRSRTLPLGHGGSHKVEYLRVSGEKHFVSLKLECLSGGRTRDLRLSKQAALTTAPGPAVLIRATRHSANPKGSSFLLEQSFCFARQYRRTDLTKSAQSLVLIQAVWTPAWQAGIHTDWIRTNESPTPPRYRLIQCIIAEQFNHTIYIV